MFRPNEIRNYQNADLITVRANMEGLQFCIFKINEDKSYTILNEGNIPIDKVLGFIVNHNFALKDGEIKSEVSNAQ